jgi:hypothetical protein
VAEVKMKRREVKRSFMTCYDTLPQPLGFPDSSNESNSQQTVVGFGTCPALEFVE